MNKTYKIFWDFEMQTSTNPGQKTKPSDNSSPPRQKKNLPYSGLCPLYRPQSENQRKRKEEQVIESCLWTKKAVEHKGDGGANGFQRLWKETEKVGNQWKNQDHPNNSITEIDQNTEKSPGDLSCHSDSSERPYANTGIKKTHKSKIMIMFADLFHANR